MTSLLWRSSLRYLRRHPWHMVLSVLGVALGVGVVFSIDLVNASARRAFQLSSAAVTGRATHHVVGGPNGLPDAVYSALRLDSATPPSAPIVEGYVGVAGLPGRAFHLLGVDPFAEPPFRSHLQDARLTGGVNLSAFILSPPSMYVPRALGRELGVDVGDSLTLRYSGATFSVVLLGFFDTESGAAQGLDNLLIVDISTAQEILGSIGRLSRIDLIVTASEETRLLGALREVLPAGAEIKRSQARSRKIEDMSLAFSQNLFALSLLALVVGMFLIYNTMTFSVVQRRTLIGDLRTLGVTQREVFGLVLTESLVMGAVGTVLGLVIGVLLARGLLGMVTQTINDLYFVLSVRTLDIGPLSVGKAVVLGVGATVLCAVMPARDATATPPRFVQNRSTIESRVRDMLPALTVGGGLLLVAGAGVLMIPTKSLLLSFVGLLPVIVGFALLTPGFLTLFLGRVSRVFGRQLGTLGRIAVRGILAQLSRSAVAIAALAIAVGTTVGVTTMVTSFRESVVNWLEVTLDADVYISAPSLVSSRTDATLEPAMVGEFVGLDGVRGANYVRGLITETQHGVTNLVALEMTAGSESRFRLLEGEAAYVWPRYERGTAALVSEPYAHRYDVGVGDSVKVRSERGLKTFEIGAVYQDYASDIGTVMISLATYREHWLDDTVSGVGLFLVEPDSLPAIMAQINGLLGTQDEVVVRSNRDLRDRSIEIFDRTFAITNVLRMLTVLVAFIGVLSALTALQLERSRELGVLRAIGLTPAQLWRLVTAQTGLMGLVSGIIALPFGIILATILIFVVNKRSFGWTLEMSLGADALVQAIIVAVVAALLAGVYPGYRMSRTPPARALREE